MNKTEIDRDDFIARCLSLMRMIRGIVAKQDYSDREWVAVMSETIVIITVRQDDAKKAAKQILDTLKNRLEEEIGKTGK